MQFDLSRQDMSINEVLALYEFLVVDIKNFKY